MRRYARGPVALLLLGLAGVSGAIDARAQGRDTGVRSPNALVRSLVQEALAREHGEAGMPRDPVRAAALYCQAARLGDPEAQYSLAWMLANSRGVERDDSSAAGLFALAASQGHEHAQATLLKMGEGATRLPDCMIEAAAKPSALEPPAVPPPAAASEQAALPPGLVARLDPLFSARARSRDAAPEDVYAELSPGKRKVAALIRWLAPRYAIDPKLALAVATAESNFEPLARSPKNAQGVMQLIPATAERFRVRNTWDPFDNIQGGLAYLRWLLAYYRGNVTFTLAAYNAGEGAVDRYGGVPPFAETREYVRKIREVYPHDEHPFDAAAAPMSVLVRDRPATVRPLR
jgi:soluble lytic murein transglycosylase-like protein